MGLLDDAIREHLDLKRRHGADPAEIERAEREALGPVRRGPGLADPLSLESEPASDDLDFGHEHESGWGEQPEAEGEPLDTVRQPHPLAQESEEPWATGEAFAADELVRDPGEPDRPEPRSDEQLGEETAEYDVEAEGEHDEDDDVLEETPEFLQDTPDHDRLWFEQRPPRDFDFDG